MKKLLFVIATSFAMIAMVGCQKTETAGVSKITYFPDFELTGGEYYSIVAGEGDYVEPGVTVTENGEEIPYTTTGIDGIDTETPGIYTISYTAVNQDGFSKSATRYVVVLPEAPDPDVDLSGNYALTSPAGYPTQALVVTKLADGVFLLNNILGPTFTINVPGIIFCTDGVNIYIPEYDALGDGQIMIVGDGGLVLSPTSFKYDSYFVFGGTLYARSRTWTKI